MAGRRHRGPRRRSPDVIPDHRRAIRARAARPPGSAGWSSSKLSARCSAPPLCAACGAPLRRRRGRSAGAAGGAWRRPSRCAAPGRRGSTRAWSSAAHEGVARELVVALKFRRLLPVAELMAERIARLAPPALLERRAGAGADRAAARAGPRLRPGRGARRRRSRRATGAALEPLPRAAAAAAARSAAGGPSGSAAPPRVERPRRGAAQRRPRRRRPDHRRDDLTACARALREAGAVRVVAVTFSRRL